MPFHGDTLARIDGRRAQLLSAVVYEGNPKHGGDLLAVPTNFWTDFATVPQFITWLIPTMGAYTNAAIVHDYLCEQLNTAYRSAGEARINARDTDGIFRRIMRELGVPPVRRWLIWTGVRWGALANPARREGWLADAPLVLLWSLLALPIVLPASIPVGVALLVDKLVEKIVGWF